MIAAATRSRSLQVHRAALLGHQRSFDRCFSDIIQRGASRFRGALSAQSRTVAGETSASHGRICGVRVARRSGPADGRQTIGEVRMKDMGLVAGGGLDRGDRGRGPGDVPADRREDRDPEGTRIRRPPQGPLHAVLRRDVGALLLLRHARAADLLPDPALAVQRRQVDADLRCLHQPGLHHPGARRISRRPLPRPAQGGAVRRRCCSPRGTA